MIPMRRPLSILVLCLLAVGVASLPRAAPAPQALDRGRLSLAWDAHEAALPGEALGYLREIPEDSPLAPEALWLEAECLSDLARYSEAAALLEGPRGGAVAEREALLLDVYWNWAWEATAREEYAAALGILARGQRALPEEKALGALAAATQFREAVAAVLSRGRSGDLPTGEAVAVRPESAKPPRDGEWIRAYPWRSDSAWVPEATLEDWMPGVAGRLDREGKTLWVRVGRGALERRLAAAAAREGLSLGGTGDSMRVSAGDEHVTLSLSEWRFRAAVEGMGVAGAAAVALGRARDRLEERREFLAWLAGNRRKLDLERRAEGVLLRHPGTGRRFQFDPDEWVEVFLAPGEEWDGFWDDLQQELARESRPFRCFCGRGVYLREVLVDDPGRAMVLDRDRGFAAVAVALCPLHHQYVTREVAQGWGVGATELARRIVRDATERPWDVSFSRGRAHGSPYLVLQGDGVSALGRSPELLLGVLEGVDGVAARGTTVRVLAPTPSTLVVVGEGTPDAAAESAAVRALLGLAPRVGWVERLDFRAEVRLPRQGRGSFRLSNAE